MLYHSLFFSWKKPTKNSLLTAEYYRHVQQADPFDDDTAVFRGIDEQLPMDRGKVSLGQGQVVTECAVEPFFSRLAFLFRLPT